MMKAASFRCGLSSHGGCRLLLLLRLGEWLLNYGEEELMMAEKYKGRGQAWAEYSATDKRNPVVNCGQDCFHRFNGCLPRGSLLV